MNFKDDIKNYQPINEQENQDQKVVIQLIEQSSLASLSATANKSLSPSACPPVHAHFFS